MGVYKNNRTNRWEWVETIDGKQIRKMSKKWTTKKMAQENLDNFIQELENRKKVQSHTSPLFKEFVKSYLRNKQLSLKQSTILRTKQTIEKHIINDFDGIHIDQIDVHLIQEWQHKLLDRTVHKREKLLSNRYLDIIQGTMKDILKFARIHGYISLNPLEMTPIALRREYEPKKQMTILTTDEINLFLSVIENKTDRLVYLILYWCGLRSGELIALNIEDYNRESKTLHVYRTYDTKNNIMTTTKTDHDRIVDLPDVVIKELDELLESYPSVNKYGYALLGYQTRLPKQTMTNRKLKYWLEANGLEIKEYNKFKKGEIDLPELRIPWFTFHELRHTHVSTLIDIGWKSKDISERLGHSVKEVEETYGHLFPKRKKEMFDKLNKLGNV